LSGVRGRPQRVPTAGSGGRRLLLQPAPAPVHQRLLLVLVYMQVADNNLIIIN